MIEKGGRSDIFVASGLGDIDQVKLQLRRGASVNGKDGLGYTPLHWASENAHLAVVKLLISRGADTNTVNCARITPLMISLMDLRTPPALKWKNSAGDNERRKSVVRYLVAHGGKTDTVNAYGRTAADYARARGYSDILSLLGEPAKSRI